MLRSKLFYLFIYFPIILLLIVSPAVRRDYFTVSFNRHVSALVFIIVVVCRSLYARNVTLSAIPIIVVFGYIISLTSGVYAASLVGFLILGSAVTKVGSKIKRQIEVDYKIEGQRKWNQVVSNSGVAVLLCLITIYTSGHGEKPIDFKAFLYGQHENLLSSYLHLAILGSISCCAGDTFSSELGTVYSMRAPVLLTQPWRRVPKGTNGGITVIGLMFSVIGGACQGFIHYAFTLIFCNSAVVSYKMLAASQWPLIVVGMVGGFVGSLIDSFLGSTIQFSGLISSTNKITDVPGTNVKPISGLPILDNDLVNFTSSLLTAFLISIAANSLSNL